MDEKVLIRATCQRMGQTDQCSPIYMFYLFLGAKVICSNPSFSKERYEQLHGIYEADAMILGMALDVLKIENVVQTDFEKYE